MYEKMIISILFLLLGVFCVTDAAPIERVMVDMTYVFDETLQHHPFWNKFNMTVILNGTVEGYGFWGQGEEIFTPTHMGTHMDSPSHMSLGGINIDEIPIENFIAPAAVINIVDKALENPDATVAVEDLEAWESITGESLNGKVVLMYSGWGKKWSNRAEYLGTDDENIHNIHSPGFSVEAAQWLVDNRHIVGVGADAISFDLGNSPDFMVHRIILGHGLYGLENVANVDKIPMYGATLYVMPMKIGRASGAPTRIIATFPKVMFHH